MEVRQPQKQADGSNTGVDGIKNDKGKKKKFFVICFVLSLIIIGGIIFYFSRIHDTEKTDGQSDVFASQDAGTSDNGKLTVYFLDVDQGDCILASYGEHHLIIDAGGEAFGTKVQKFLTDRGITELDYCIGTHFDADHIGGMDVILQKFDCGQVILPDYVKDTMAYDNLMRVINSKGIKVTSPVVGDEYSLGEASFTIIAPSGNGYEDENDYSIGIILKNGANGFVFTGDATMLSEEEMLASGIPLDADVLKAAHHGSSYSTGNDFLKAVSPEYVVVSCGKDNDYGHPHRSFLNRVEEAGCRILRTDELGTVAFTSDGESVSYISEK